MTPNGLLYAIALKDLVCPLLLCNSTASLDVSICNGPWCVHLLEAMTLQGPVSFSSVCNGTEGLCVSTVNLWSVKEFKGLVYQPIQ